MSGTNDDYRTGSADSENSSDSYVQVNKEDAPQPEQLMDSDLPPSVSEPTESDVPPVEEEEPVEEQEEEEPSTAPTDKEVKCVSVSVFGIKFFFFCANLFKLFFC